MKRESKCHVNSGVSSGTGGAAQLSPTACAVMLLETNTDADVAPPTTIPLLFFLLVSKRRILRLFTTATCL